MPANICVLTIVQFDQRIMLSTARDRVRLVRFVAAIACALSIGSGIAAAQKASRVEPHKATLRTLDDVLIEVIARGMTRSDTFRTLVEHLERSQTIVYLSRVPVPPAIQARTRLFAAANGWRFLSIDLDWRLADIDLITTLGHELQHAAEIADAVEVVDQISLAALYGRIGMKRSYGDAPVLTYETTRAVETGRRIYGELLGGTRH
jgi:hypothetical protein